MIQFVLPRPRCMGLNMFENMTKGPSTCAGERRPTLTPELSSWTDWFTCSILPEEGA